MDTTNYPALAALIKHCEELRDCLDRFIERVEDDELTEQEISRVKVYLAVAADPLVDAKPGETFCNGAQRFYAEKPWERIEIDFSNYECDRARAEEEQAQEAEDLRQQDLADYWQMTAGSLATSNGY